MHKNTRDRLYLSPRAIALALMLAAQSAHSLEAAAPPLAADLARRNGCMACHGLIHKQVGPGFAQVADRYRNDGNAPARLAAKIRSGSVGTWGRVIMPQQAQVSQSEALALAQWVLSQPSAR